jgi:predicted DNA-binding transcriptional regulator YafY
MSQAREERGKAQNRPSCGRWVDAAWALVWGKAASLNVEVLYRHMTPSEAVGVAAGYQEKGRTLLARHEKLSRSLDLILTLTGTRMGRTVRELAEEMNCGARTMERMLAAIRQVSGDRLEMLDTDSREKRYRLRGRPFLAATPIHTDEITELDLAVRRLEGEGQLERARSLRSAAQKLRALASEDALRRSELDAELLLEAEGLAARPGPRVTLSAGLLAALRAGILGSQAVRVRYHAGKAGESRDYEIYPLGLLYGARPYLVAVLPGKPEPSLWRLDRIETATPAESGFARPANFDLQAFAARSFGLWQGEPEEVVLRFTGDAAAEAAKWSFHPTQTIAVDPDGSTLVRFCAAGRIEICLHLFGWGDSVEILAPEGLRMMLAERAGAAARHHGAMP